MTAVVAELTGAVTPSAVSGFRPSTGTAVSGSVAASARSAESAEIWVRLAASPSAASSCDVSAQLMSVQLMSVQDIEFHDIELQDIACQAWSLQD